MYSLRRNNQRTNVKREKTCTIIRSMPVSTNSKVVTAVVLNTKVIKTPNIINVPHTKEAAVCDYSQLSQADHQVCCIAVSNHSSRKMIRNGPKALLLVAVYIHFVVPLLHPLRAD